MKKPTTNIDDNSFGVPAEKVYCLKCNVEIDPRSNSDFCEKCKPLFGGDYESRLRATVDKLLKKAESMEEVRAEYQKITDKIAKEYET